jgi:signal transduction histidine kinase
MGNERHPFVSRALSKLGKLSPEQVQRLVAVATEESERQDAILASLPIGLVIYDETGHIVQKNKAADRFFSYASDMQDFIDANLEKRATNVSRDFTATTHSGAARFLTLTILPLVRGKRVAGSIVKIEDTTDKYKRDVLSRRMEHLSALTNLAASVAHEIKNPLAGISIHIQLMQKAFAKARFGDGMLPDKKYAEDYLAVVNEEIDRLNKIVVDFLFAVRPVKASLQPFDVDDLVSKFADFFAPELAAKGIDFQVRLWSKGLDAREKAFVMLDEQLFRQMLVNLGKNAVEALESVDPMNPGAEIFITSQVRDDRYLFTLRDNGPGMSSETAGHIFEPYYTTKASGSGLGLTMVYKIVKEMLGDIDVKTAPGSGCAFLVSFPLPQSETRLLGA